MVILNPTRNRSFIFNKIYFSTKLLMYEYNSKMEGLFLPNKSFVDYCNKFNVYFEEYDNDFYGKIIISDEDHFLFLLRFSNEKYI